MMNQNTTVSVINAGTLTFEGETIEGIDIVIHYDIANKRIKSHYPDLEKY